VTETNELINVLVECAIPMHRLRPPLARASLWVCLAGLMLLLLFVGHGVRADLVQKLREPDFVVALAASLASGILATIAAFMIMLPDRSRWWLLLPTPAIVVWFATIGYGCLTDWVNIGPDGVQLGETAACFGLILWISAPLAIALMVMLRYAAFLRAGAVVMMGSLAVAGISTAAHSVLHDHDATALILLWNLGPVALITGMAGLFGCDAFRSMAARLMPMHPAL
jgi:hypothetical protein